MAPEAARQAALQTMGGVDRIREECRDQRGIHFIDATAQDIRYTLRTLARNPTFSAVAILTLALSIGATTAIFQLLDTVVLRSLPVQNPEQLVVPQGFHNEHENGFSYPLLREMNARQTTVQGIFASAPIVGSEVILDGQSAPIAPPATWLATGNYFRLIGTGAQIGRLFAETDDEPGS